MSPSMVGLIVALGIGLATSATAGGGSRLADAAKAQDWVAVGDLVDGDGVDVNEPQADGATALHWAAHWNHLETVDALLMAGADVRAANDYGATALWVACANRHTAVVHRLLEGDADPNRGLDSGETVLMRCAHTGDAGAVRALVTRGAEVDAREPSRGQTALMRAVVTGHADVVQVLVDHGAAVDARTTAVEQLRGTGLRSTTSPEGATVFEAGAFTPLLFAARHGELASAAVLLEAGANIDDAAADGNTPLVMAAMSGHGRLSELFLQHGADPNADGAGYTALHAAVLRADLRLAQVLLHAGADPNHRVTRGTPVPRWTYQLVLTLRERHATPFALAAKYLEPEMLRVLLAAGADPHVSFDDGTTPLMAAVGVGLSRATNRRNQLVAPELVTAEWENESRVLQTLRVVLDAGGAGSVNQTGRRGETALHVAARLGFENVVELLIGHGGRLDVENENGDTPARLLAASASP